ncbi:hypothetical protein ABY45_11565 [Microbacterium maritypicum]|uniref:hypothetical protein n=1 Tax=Microbacterium maritypicum TaxID=33918 RepID=UPI003D6EA93F
MQIWVPQWSVRPPQNSEGASWFGGVPTGLAADRWPVCGECGAVMTPLLQLAPGPWLPRVPASCVLLVFKCESDAVCDFWEPDEVANRCLLVPSTELAGESHVPSAGANGETPVLPRLWVRDWVPSDDGITAEQARQIDDPVAFWALPDEITAVHGFDSNKLTKAGGAPYWTGNGPSDVPPRPRQLLFQVDNWITAIEPSEEVSAYIGDQDLRVAVAGSSVSAANFMSDGIAFVFDITPDDPLPTPRLAINR